MHISRQKSITSRSIKTTGALIVIPWFVYARCLFPCSTPMFHYMSICPSEFLCSMFVLYGVPLHFHVRGHVAWTPFSKTMSMYLLNVRVRAHAAVYFLSWHQNPYFRFKWPFCCPLKLFGEKISATSQQ
jgi:hypothetical protein